jgi:hypothetical protein
MRYVKEKRPCGRTAFISHNVLRESSSPPSLGINAWPGIDGGAVRSKRRGRFMFAEFRPERGTDLAERIACL